MFRWPLRVSEYLYLALLLLFAQLLTRGLATTHVRVRIVGSVVAIGAPVYLAWAHNPGQLHRLAAGTVLVAVLTVLAIGAARLGPLRSLALAGVFIVGTGLTLTLQLKTFGENKSSRGWHVPSDVAAMNARFNDRSGTVMQFSNFDDLQHMKNLAQLADRWRDFLPGSLYDVTDVRAVNHYTGMGLVRFQRSLCMSYEGFTKPCGYRSIFSSPQLGLPPLADLMKVETIVVSPKQAAAARTTPPSGWTQVSGNGQVQVYRRDDPLPWPGSHLSFVPHGVQVSAAANDDARHEHVDFADTANGGRAVFAMLGWPGWNATLDGHPVPVGRDSAGLLTVVLPAHSKGRLELTFTPPGLKIGLAAAAVGLLGAVALGWFGRRRKARDEEPNEPEEPVEPEDPVAGAEDLDDDEAATPA